MKSMTAYEVIERIFNFLRDEYAMENDKIHEIINIIPDGAISAIANHAITVSDIINPMINYGNMKTEQVISKIIKSSYNDDAWVSAQKAVNEVRDSAWASARKAVDEVRDSAWAPARKALKHCSKEE